MGKARNSYLLTEKQRQVVEAAMASPCGASAVALAKELGIDKRRIVRHMKTVAAHAHKINEAKVKERFQNYCRPPGCVVKIVTTSVHSDGGASEMAIALPALRFLGQPEAEEMSAVDALIRSPL